MSVHQIKTDRNSVVDSMSAALLEMEMLDAAAVERARRAHGRTGAGFDTVLTELGLLSEDQLAHFWAKWLDIPLLADFGEPDAPVLPDLLPRKFLTANALVPLREDPGVLWVAMADPLDRQAISSIEYLMEAEIRPVAASRRHVADLLRRLYETGVAVEGEAEGRGFAAAGGEDSDIEHLRALANEGPVIQRVNALLSAALEAGASDIHLEPGRSDLSVRFRVDGHLQEIERIAGESRAAVISRVKIMSRMDITERRLPQDGRVSVTIRGRSVDLRISTLPTVHGESTVIRLLRREEGQLDWAALGFTKEVRSRLGELLADPNGIFLVTGPTGSGKTTTLYTALRDLNTADRKLVSVEDPVEYQLAGVNQVHVQSDIGLTFAHALRSILRQDPDIIMIGEIRDLETAEIAIRASLTGHLVLSTLHTNSAAAAITRLVEMGTAPYLVAACVRGVLSQRLVRTLCPHCAAPLGEDQLPPALRGTGGDYRRPVGCPSCRETGYSGRQVVSELLLINEAVRGCILDGANEDAIARAAAGEGLPTLAADGLRAAAAGMTSLEEVYSVAGRRGVG